MPKKAKTTKAPKTLKGRSTDAITGMKWNLDGNTIQSDMVYKDDNPISQLLSGPGHWDTSTEFELGDPRFIVYTTSFSYRDSNISNRQTTHRMVLEGHFKYDGKSLISASIKRISDDSRSVIYWDDVNKSPTETRGGHIGLLSAINKGFALTDPHSLASFAAAHSELSPTAPYPELAAEAKYSTHPPLGSDAGSENIVRAYQSGRFFPDGWWNNPFTPNLI
jgi:hypothetical protein